MGNDNDKNSLEALASLGTDALKMHAKKYILAAVLPILPYILLSLLVILVFSFIYFGIMDQANKVISTSGDLGERIGNAFTMYGFKTEAEVEADEEVRFYKRIDKYKESGFFKYMSTYDWVLVMRTLLYEGNLREKMYLNGSVDISDSIGQITDDAMSGNLDVGSFVKSVGAGSFIKDIGVSFSQGYNNSYMGSSQYKKANKNLLEVATAVKKCHNLLGNTAISPEFRKCYEGYLVAEFNVDIDLAIELKQIEPEVEKGNLVFNFFGMDFNDIEVNDNGSFINNFISISKKIQEFSDDTITTMLTGLIGLGIKDNVKQYVDRFRQTIMIYTNGKIAGSAFDGRDFSLSNLSLENVGQTIKDIFSYSNSDHFYYNGYIVKYLKEYYKIGNVYHDGSIDKNMVMMERQNKKAIVEDIYDSLYDYCKYGDDICDVESLVTGSSVIASGNIEAKSSVKVSINGIDSEISFNDYVLLFATNIYGDELKQALEEGNYEKVSAILSFSKQYVYSELGFGTGDSLTYHSNNNFDNTFYLSLTQEQKDKMNELMNTYMSKTIRDSNGKVVNLTVAQRKAILEALNNGISYENALKLVLGDSYKLSSGFQGPLDGTLNVTTGYNEDRWGTVHHGIDFSAAEGTPVYSVSDGIVTDVVNWCKTGSLGDSCGGGFGNRVYVAYTNGDGHTYYVIYAHLSSIGNVNVGDRVSAGSVVGYVGSTGSSTGNHLHLEVRVDSTNSGVETVNPSTFFNFAV